MEQQNRIIIKIEINTQIIHSAFRPHYILHGVCAKVSLMSIMKVVHTNRQVRISASFLSVFFSYNKGVFLVSGKKTLKKKKKRWIWTGCEFMLDGFVQHASITNPKKQHSPSVCDLNRFFLHFFFGGGNKQTNKHKGHAQTRHGPSYFSCFTKETI